MPTRHLDLRRALALSVVSIAWSGVVGSFAVVVALSSNSLSLLGFGADAVIDAFASIVLVWRFRVEVRHPHHADRVEQAAERGVGLALLALALYLVFGAVRALMTGGAPHPSDVGLGLLIASFLVLPPLAVAKNRVAARLRSGALRADSILTAVAAVLAAISLVSLAASSSLGLWWADAASALVVAAIVVREGWSSLRATAAA